MNRLQKKILTIALGIANVSICLSAAAVATYAWFRMQNAAGIEVADDDISISTRDPDEKLTYKFYKYDDNLKAGKGFTNPSDFVLPDYDTYITEKNVHANIILRAEVSMSALDTDLYEFSIDVTRLASDFMTDNKIGKFTSNIIQLKSTVYAFKEVGEEEYTINTASMNSIDETSDATIYSTASAYFASRQTPTTFVPIRYLDDGTPIVNRNNGAGDCTISLIPDLPEGFNVTDVVMYLEFSYHETLVNKYVETNSAEGSTKYSLTGDISKIVFSKREKVAQTSLATGKYIKVESNTGLVNGQYLHAYETDEATGAAKVLRGSLANSEKAATASGGIYASPNTRDVTINSNPSTEPKSIDSTDSIDADSFDFEKTNKTFKSKAGYYVGNDTASTGLASKAAYSVGLSNDISFSGSHALIKGYGDGTYPTRTRFYSNRIYYVKSTSNTAYKTDLFRYTENVAEMPVLQSIAITTQTTNKTFYVGGKFAVTSLVVTATYSNGSTANVTGSCTYTSDTNPTTLVPNSTVFNNVEASKTIYVNYTEGGVTIPANERPSYTVQVKADELNSLTITSPATNIYYYVGDTFSTAGLAVRANYKSGVQEANITPTSITSPDMSTAGTKTITISYTVNGITKTTSYSIYVRAKALSINTATLTVYEDETGSITVTHNQDVSIATSGTGSVTLSPATTIEYTGEDKSTIESTLSITGVSTGTVTITLSSPGCSNVTCTVTVSELPSNHFTIAASEIVDNSTYQAYTKTISKVYVDGGTSESKDWIITFGGNTGSLGTNSGNRSNCNLSGHPEYAVSPVSTSDTAAAFASTSLMSKIRNITFTHTGGSYNTSTLVYVLYSTNGETFTQPTLAAGSAAQGMTMSAANTTYTFAFSQPLTGYFALVFKATNSSSQNWRIDGLSLEYNKRVLDSIAISGDCTTKTYSDGASLNTSGLIVTATYTDGSTANVTASATLTPATNPLHVGTTSVVVNASYTYDGVTKNASITITGITVNAVLVTSITLNKSSTTIAVGATETLSVSSILPANATDKTVTWSVYSGASYATVSSVGVVTGTAAGTAVIRATANDGSGVYAACTVTVTTAKTLSSITLSGTYPTTFNVGDTFSYSGLVVTAHYSDSSTATVTPTSVSTPNMSTSGTKTVTVSYTEGGVTKTATYNITVNAATTDHTFTWTATSGGLGSGIGSGTINLTGTNSEGTKSVSYTRTLKSGTSYTGWTSNCIQLGKNGGVENITFTCSSISGTIKSVSVECSSYNNAHKVSIKVGSTTYLASTSTAKWTTVNAKSGTGTSSGTITISFTDGTRALYIKSITVVANY